MVKVTQTVEVHLPGWKWRFILSGCLCLLFVGADMAFDVFVRGDVNAFALKQFDGDAQAYQVMRATGRDPVFYLTLLLAGFLAVVWGSYLLKMVRYLMLAVPVQNGAEAEKKTDA